LTPALRPPLEYEQDTEDIEEDQVWKEDDFEGEDESNILLRKRGHSPEAELMWEMQHPIEVNPDGGFVYCRLGGEGYPGKNGGAPITFPKPMIVDNIDFRETPACITLEKDTDRNFVISQGKGHKRFFYSMDRAPKVGKNMACIYPTMKPRCADIYGSLRNNRALTLACEEESNEPSCTIAAYDQLCKDTRKKKDACGFKKQTQDILKCCDKNENLSGKGCLGSHRRRLTEALKIKKGLEVEGALAEDCARKCLTLGEGDAMSDGACVAWRIQKDLEGKSHCILAKQCAPKGSKRQRDGKWETKEWFGFKGINPYKGLKKKVRKFKKKMRGGKK